MRKLVILLVAIAMLGAIYVSEKRRRAEQLKPVFTVRGPAAQGTLPATPLALTDISGKRIETSSYRGKVVLVNFWAAWCTPCAEEIPKIMDLQQRYRAQGLEVLGISMDDTDIALREFYAKYKMNYTVVPGSASIAEAYGGILGLPTTILIARDGRMAGKMSGIADFPKLEQEINDLLAQ